MLEEKRTLINRTLKNNVFLSTFPIVASGFVSVMLTSKTDSQYSSVS